MCLRAAVRVAVPKNVGTRVTTKFVERTTKEIVYVTRKVVAAIVTAALASQWCVEPVRFNVVPAQLMPFDFVSWGWAMNRCRILDPVDEIEPIADFKWNLRFVSTKLGLVGIMQTIHLGCVFMVSRDGMSRHGCFSESFVPFVSVVCCIGGATQQRMQHGLQHLDKD